MTAHVVQHRFQHMPLWGQFVNRYGDAREDVAFQFRDRLRQHSSLEELDCCFPFQVLSLEAPVDVEPNEQCVTVLHGWPPIS